MHPSDKDPNNPTGQRYAQDFCEEHDLDPELWGHINNVGLDGYHHGRDEIRPLVKLLSDKATHEREASEFDKASGLEIAAKALKLILLKHLAPEEALTKATTEQEEADFAAAMEGIDPS